MSEDIAAALASPLRAQSLVAVGATVSTGGGHRVLRVLVDRDVSGLDPADTSSRVRPLTLDEVAAATTVVGAALDEGDLMGERPYTLEVSSPGVGRPVQGYAAFRRNVGRLVAVTTASGETITARVISVSAAEIVLEVPAGRKTPAERRTLPLTSVRSGAVQVEFGRADDTDDDDTDDDLDDDNPPDDSTRTTKEED